MSQRLRSARVISAGHAFVPTCAAELELSVDLNPNHQLPAAFTELAQAIQTAHRPQLTVPIPPLMQQRRALAGLDRSLVVLVGNLWPPGSYFLGVGKGGDAVARVGLAL
jgi:hypothetical protein